MCKKNPHNDRYQFQWRWLAVRYWPTWCGLVLYFIVTLLPMGIIDSLAGRLGLYAARKNKKRFAIAKKNISLCFPDKDEEEVEQMVLAHFKAQFQSVLHYYILWWRPEFWVKKKIEMRGFEQIDHYRQRDKNIIVLLTHNVGLEFASPAITMNHATSAPFKAMRNPVINWLVAWGRVRFGKKLGGKLFTREDGLRPLIRELRAGKILVYIADEDLGEKYSVFAPFYGVSKATLPVLSRLVKSANAVVLPCASIYHPEQKKYSITLLPKIEGIPSGDDVLDATIMNQAIQSVIDMCPVQYLWTLRYFQTRPAGEASVYE